ncbi:MAG: hypothetical protein ACI9KE_004058 [Polyangiales bacterium]|jgi:hypothetical protein
MGHRVPPERRRPHRVRVVALSPEDERRENNQPLRSYRHLTKANDRLCYANAVLRTTLFFSMFSIACASTGSSPVEQVLHSAEANAFALSVRAESWPALGTRLRLFLEAPCRIARNHASNSVPNRSTQTSLSVAVVSSKRRARSVQLALEPRVRWIAGRELKTINAKTHELRRGARARPPLETTESEEERHRSRHSSRVAMFMGGESTHWGGIEKRCSRCTVHVENSCSHFVSAQMTPFKQG